MTIRQLAQIMLTAPDLDKNAQISYRGSWNLDITSIGFDTGGNLTIGVSGYNQDKVTVRTEIEVKSPYSKEPQIF